VSDTEDTPRFAVRISVQANRDITQATVRIAGLNDDDKAIAWSEAIHDAIVGLAENPRRFAVDPQATKVLSVETRRFLFHTTPAASMAYHVFFDVQEDGQDGRRVTVMHVRHAARRPMTRAEARQIVANQ
jgi:plasmid stabilization system protein ParE